MTTSELNPFRPPAEDASDVSGHSPEWIERLASLKRLLGVSFLVQVFFFAGVVLVGSLGVVLPRQQPPAFEGLIAVAGLALVVSWINTQVQVYRVLAYLGSHTGALLMVVLLGTPLGGALSVIIASRRATKALRRGGYEPGFLGLRRRTPR